MIARAARDVGLREPNYIQTWYRKRNGSAYAYNFPWCDAAVTRWAYDSGNYDAVCYGTDYAYTVAHAQHAKNEGDWHYGTSGIRRGDIAFVDWSGGNSIAVIDHVGVVTGAAGSYVHMIEGNTADVCARRVRHTSLIVGYIRPRYGDTGAVRVPQKAAVPGRLSVDGQLGRLTAGKTQQALKVAVDNVWGPTTVRALQDRVRAKQDGILGRDTTRKTQKYVGAVVDGIWPSIRSVSKAGIVTFDVAAKSETTEKLQKALNAGKF